MKLAAFILILVGGVQLETQTPKLATEPGGPIATIGPLQPNGDRAITYQTNGCDPSNYLWILEIAPSPQGPFELCHEAHYLHGKLVSFDPRPNSFYRLHGLTNDGSYNYF